jgi:D-serine deaminase-like pyridoxal phosphate-dependent protein
MGERSMLQIPDSIDTPSLVIDLDILQQNIDSMAADIAGMGVALAPHAKTHRTPQIARMQMDAGAEALCIAKLGEAEVLAETGLDSFVMAYPIVGEVKLDRARRLMESASILLSVDSPDAGRALAANMSRAGVEADVLVIVDTGYHRCGVSPVDAPDLAAYLSGLDGIRLRGFITHEGHAYGAPDADGLRGESVAAGEAIVGAAEAARERGLDIDVISVGSSATARHSASAKGVTQARPGIYAFNDYGQVLRGVVDMDRCAARVAATVVSHVTPGQAILDAGSKALSQDRLGIHVPGAPGVFGLVVDLPGWELFQLSEEHGWVRWIGEGAPGPLEIGQRVQILPNHICSIFHMLGQSEIVRSGEHVDTWHATARGASR